jgi:hypothetical protein
MTERTLPALPPMPEPEHHASAEAEAVSACSKPKPERLDPTRYGDWELHGKCVDF